MTSSHTIRTTAAAALLALAMSAPALAQQDLRSPDTRDAAIAATHKQDLRSPDARDAARTSEIARQIRRFAATSQSPAAARGRRAVVDLRRSLGTSSLAGTASPRTSVQPLPASGGFDWLSAAIGAIAAAGLALASWTAVGTRRTAHA
jgi:hypothetical protein